MNHITGDATAATLPINQCVGSTGGGGTSRTCSPDPATADASLGGITQCNGSSSGGGGSMTCSVLNPDPDSGSGSGEAIANSAFSFLANQCNGSATGGGAEMICTTTVSTVIVPAEGDDDDTGGETGGTGGSTVTTPRELATTGTRAELIALMASLLFLIGGVVAVGARRPSTRA